ncbi:MAG: Rne/Rng family ribonuclease [candidate division WOR-3 bacterium]
MKISTKIIFSSYYEDNRCAFLEGERLTEFYIESPEVKSEVGRIYKGKVENVVKGLRGAFVNLGLKKNGFLPLAEIPDEAFLEKEEIKEEGTVVNPGDEILCQVVKEAMGEKGSRLTSYVHIPGHYLVYFPTIDRIGISQRIRDKKERGRLRDILKRIKKPGVGIIIRTAAEFATEENLRKEYLLLEETYEKIKNKWEGVKSPSLLYEEPVFPIRMVRDLYTPDTEVIYCDTKEAYEILFSYLQGINPESVSRLKLYEGEKPIFEKMRIEEELKKALERKIWLKSGGFITIDQTEAIVAIDVNTGRFSQEEDPETLILQTNLEAASEIARAIRLRDLSGLIIIDFIDMQEQKNMERVVEELKLCLENDRAKSDFARISRFGILEMTREKIRPSLFDSLFETCPVCFGRGRIPNRYEVAVKIKNQLLAKAENIKGKKVKIIVSHFMYNYLVGDWQENLKKLVKSLKIALDLKLAPELSPTGFKIMMES